jgi:hypothetical protein
MTDEIASQAAKILGARRSRKKSIAARENGKRGGRPKGSKDRIPRKRQVATLSKRGETYEVFEDL